ncbi:MAG: DoxX protein [Parcubacteria group bacterium Gr01-1014_44]|nr:MAG: DoxX protein [Parcubacteria group bacterium Gr01-1014_44]
MGWFYFYAGITKVLDSEWSAAGYVKGAQNFVDLYQWFLSPQVLPVVDFMVKWGLTLLGVSLILGLFVRLSSYLGMLLMFLFYLPILNFPMAGAHAYLVDDHIIYMAGLLALASFKAGHVWGLEKWCSSLPICSKYPKLRSLIG